MWEQVPALFINDPSQLSVTIQGHSAGVVVTHIYSCALLLTQQREPAGSAGEIGGAHGGAIRASGVLLRHSVVVFVPWWLRPLRGYVLATARGAHAAADEALRSLSAESGGVF